uniref:NADH dehydrogenase subunit 5 n=1 Tax=Pentidionis agamae TaxID=3091002 RepID=UPI0030036278|nr:NADH dehydrogenase subunit 5 [Pentidionis agamae]
MVLFFSFFLFLCHLFLFLFSFFSPFFILEFESFSLFSFPFSFVFLMDWISFLFSSFVIFISSIIVYYSGYYMFGDFFMSRFILVLILFVFSMILLIFGGNFFMIMVGWDGLGLVSFCLVVYYSDKDAMVSGIITIMMNRFGDGFLLVSMFFFNLIGGFNLDFFLFTNWGSFFLLVSFLTKSAQFPFSAWLPAAMSAPTPISSLVHSSTLVTAGIYLSIRFSFLFINSFISFFLMVISLLTLMLGGALANFEMDFKSIVAMSTLSQLGLLFFLISIGSLSMCFFHMISHAFFKSLLFMGTGSVIISGSQDSRLKGSSLLISPFIYSSMVVSLFSLMAVPFSVGFFSKDLALDFIFGSGVNFLLYFIFLLGSLMTVMYSLRIMFLILPLLYGGGVIMENNYSKYMYVSFFGGIILTLLWGSFVYLVVLMEDFILVSFPFKMVGGFLILLGIFFSGSYVGLSFFYSFLTWFKYLILKLFYFDLFYKFDQVWVENLIYKSSFVGLSSLKGFVSLSGEVFWVSFFSIWFVFFIFLSLTT